MYSNTSRGCDVQSDSYLMYLLQKSDLQKRIQLQTVTLEMVLTPVCTVTVV